MAGVSSMPAPAPDVPCWYYAINGHRLGPISTNELVQMLLRGPYDPWMLIWRQGMGNWAPVAQVPELALPGLPAAPPPPPMGEIRQGNVVRQARVNCVGFAISLGLCSLLLVPALIFEGGAGCLYLCLIVPTGLYATIYMPMRMRVISSLSAGYRIAGTICGLALIAMFWLTVIVGLLRVL